MVDRDGSLINLVNWKAVLASAWDTEETATRGLEMITRTESGRVRARSLKCHGNNLDG